VSDHSETTEKEYIQLMVSLAYDSMYFEDILKEFLYQLEQGETRRMSAVIALNNFDLIAS
jgi:hypothetical protein